MKITNQKAIEDLVQWLRWKWGTAILDKDDAFGFQDHCECYSEITTCPCTLRVEFHSHQACSAPDSHLAEGIKETEAQVLKWARKWLSWQGCEYCGENTLDIDIRVLPDVSTALKYDYRPYPGTTGWSKLN
jgi:hypothetical protein